MNVYDNDTGKPEMCPCYLTLGPHWMLIGWPNRLPALVIMKNYSVYTQNKQPEQIFLRLPKSSMFLRT
jgi:hypothetical protein